MKYSPFLEHLLPPSVGVAALHPRTYGYIELHFSILGIAIQEYARGINLKIFVDDLD